MKDNDYELLIIGAGAAGLRAAQELKDYTDSMVILEENSTIGGRIKTYERDGFLLDRGFQILLTGYPEVQKTLDVDALNVGTFINGARIRTDSGMVSLTDPLSHPYQGFLSILNQVGTLGDKWKLFRLRQSLKGTAVDELFEQDNRSTEVFLKDYGFSESMIENFFRPFFSGVFLENELQTASGMFKFVYKMFNEGAAALPENGMQAIPRQLGTDLPDDCFKMKTAVESIEDQSVHLESGETITSEIIIDATAGERPGDRSGSDTDRPWNRTNCYYFSVEESPTDRPILCLNAADGFINNLCFPDLVHPSYAPDGKHLLSVSTLAHPDENVPAIREELKKWFGPGVEDWDLLGRYEIHRALPRFEAGMDPDDSDLKIEEGFYQAGDHLTTPSLNGALKSGRLAAETIIEDHYV